MIELPKHDERACQLFDGVELLTVAFGLHTIPASRLHDIRCFAAVARNTTFFPQFGQRHNPTVITEDHPQRRGATFDGFHLQYRRRVCSAASWQDGNLLNEKKGRREWLHRRSARVFLAFEPSAKDW